MYLLALHSYALTSASLQTVTSVPAHPCTSSFGDLLFPVSSQGTAPMLVWVQLGAHVPYPGLIQYAHGT